MSERAVTGGELRFGRRGIALRQRMASIARDAAMRLAPFDCLGRETSFSPYAYLLEGASPAQREAVEDSFVKHLQYVVSDHVCRDEEALQAWDKLDAEFQRGFAARYVGFHLEDPELSVKESKQIIRSVCERELPGFAHRGSKSGITSFERGMKGVDRFLVEFDLGSFGAGKFNVYLSTDGPAYSVELPILLSIRPRAWMYSTTEGCSAAVSAVCSLLRILIPVLEKKLLELSEIE